MKTLKKLFFLWPITPVLFLSIFSCSSSQHKEEVVIPQEKVIAAHAAKQRDNQLMLTACNWPELEDVKGFSLYYQTTQKLELPEVRELFVASVEEFLDLANAEPELETYLGNQKISIQNLDFTIGFIMDEGEFFDPPFVAYAYLDHDHICYCYYDHLFGTFTDYADIKESYTEALMLVHEKDRESSETENLAKSR